MALRARAFVLVLQALRQHGDDAARRELLGYVRRVPQQQAHDGAEAYAAAWGPYSRSIRTKRVIRLELMSTFAAAVSVQSVSQSTPAC